jgi:hypothetical protein
MTKALWRAPFIVCAVAALAWGVWLGLLRIGWALPLPKPDQLILHGPLMVGGFLGTLIGLERAIGVSRRWAFAAPVATAAGAVVLLADESATAGAALITAGSFVVLAVFLDVVRRHPSAAMTTMLAGTAAWCCGNLQWAAGAAVYRVVFWWMLFLVLTIAGERLELNRFRRPNARTRHAFTITVIAALVGSALTHVAPELGVRIVGTTFLAMAVWLMLNDVATRTVRQPGLTRYIAICMLTAYVWLGVAGTIAIASGAYESGFVHDALLHAVFLGFAITMVFGHAPIIFPAITGRPFPFAQRMYGPYVVLQASVALRLAGDLVDAVAVYRRWGGLLNAVALLLFVANTAMTAGIGAASRRAA